MVGERKDFSCTPEPAVIRLEPKSPEPSASFEATPLTGSMAAKPPPKEGVLDVISDVARELVNRMKKG